MLPEPSLPYHVMNELDRKDQPMAGTSGGSEASPLLGGDPAGCGAEHGLRGRASVGGEDTRDTQPDRATRFIETTHGTLSYQELAPLLADRVVMRDNPFVVARSHRVSP